MTTYFREPLYDADLHRIQRPKRFAGHGHTNRLILPRTRMQELLDRLRIAIPKPRRNTRHGLALGITQQPMNILRAPLMPLAPSQGR